MDAKKLLQDAQAGMILATFYRSELAGEKRERMTQEEENHYRAVASEQAMTVIAQALVAIATHLIDPEGEADASV